MTRSHICGPHKLRVPTLTLAFFPVFSLSFLTGKGDYFGFPLNIPDVTTRTVQFNLTQLLGLIEFDHQTNSNQKHFNGNLLFIVLTGAQEEMKVKPEGKTENTPNFENVVAIAF